MTEKKNHPEFDAAPEERRWTKPLNELVEPLRKEAYALKGDGWAWVVLPRGAVVALRILPDFRKQIRIMRRGMKKPERFLAEIGTFLEHLGIRSWEATDGALPVINREVDAETYEGVAEYTEPVPFGGRAPTMCERCGKSPVPAESPYRENICNQCALELGKADVEARKADHAQG